MKSVDGYKTSIKIYILLLMVVLFLGKNITVFILTYLLVLLAMLVRTLVIPSKKRTKAYLAAVYAGITVVQIVICMQITFADNNSFWWLYFSLFFSTVVTLFPFVVERIVTINKYAEFYFPSPKELTTLSFAEIKKNKNKIMKVLTTLNKASKSFSAENLMSIISDLPRHNSFDYICRDSLADEYFEVAEASLDDPNIYIIISNTGSAAGEIISAFTQKSYTHASMSFDIDLKTIISYNGGERVHEPGLNHEMIDYFNKKDDASIIVYSLECTRDQKKMILDKVREINSEGSAYNMMGLVLKYSHKPNIMFCSQFVYRMLEYAGLQYFTKKASEVRPTDLIELDYYRKLRFEFDIQLNRYIAKD